MPTKFSGTLDARRVPRFIPPSQVTKSWTPAPIAVAVHKGKIAGVAAEGSASGVTGQPVARRKAVGRRTSGCCKKTKLGSFC
jgi:hypothetical protein